MAGDRRRVILSTVKLVKGPRREIFGRAYRGIGSPSAGVWVRLGGVMEDGMG